MIPVVYGPLLSHRAGGASSSPEKPRLFREALSQARDIPYAPATAEDLRVAHTAGYVDGFLSGLEPHASNGVPWSVEYARAATHCVGAAIEAVRILAEKKEEFLVCPVSGFHHATPSAGRGFCAFSGQVIASVLEHRRSGAVGCYLDLDAHDGDSIERSRRFCPDLDVAVPRGNNVNPAGLGASYIKSLRASLRRVSEVDYVVYCHGADSCEGDDLGRGQCTEDEWFECSRIVCEWAKSRGVPVGMMLFGGYRKDYSEVVGMHVRDAELCQSLLSGRTSCRSTGSRS